MNSKIIHSLSRVAVLLSIVTLARKQLWNCKTVFLLSNSLFAIPSVDFVPNVPVVLPRFLYSWNHTKPFFRDDFSGDCGNGFVAFILAK